MMQSCMRVVAALGKAHDQIVDQAGPYLSDAFVDSRFEFRGKTLRGQPENRPRWNRGVALVDGQLLVNPALTYVQNKPTLADPSGAQ